MIVHQSDHCTCCGEVFLSHSNTRCGRSPDRATPAYPFRVSFMIVVRGRNQHLVS
ncbi:MAG: hypothetical protein IPL78_34170 [Chloroflexi bacterium]|nr:hypothetical protein [Chloroflexota bacterium]